MRNALTLILSVVLVAGALSAVVATATVQWLYPSMAAGDDGPGLPTSTAQQTPASTEELLALDLIRKAGSGDLGGARAIAPAVAEAHLNDQVARLGARPLRAARLPAPPEGGTPVLVWADYRAGGFDARGMYQVDFRDGQVTAFKGPLSPSGGLAPLSLIFQDEKGKKVNVPQRPLILIAPRTPQADLAETMEFLRNTYAPQGIDVALVIDIGSPDWAPAARAGGYQGPVWRVKARLEDVPVVSRGEYLGAYGLLVDRDGNPVASLAALNPLQYDLRTATTADVAPVVLRAYGLLP